MSGHTQSLSEQCDHPSTCQQCQERWEAQAGEKISFLLSSIAILNQTIHQLRSRLCFAEAQIVSTTADRNRLARELISQEEAGGVYYSDEEPESAFADF